MPAASGAGKRASPPPPSPPCIDDFDVGQELGRGGFAVVYRARVRVSGLEVALKVVDKHRACELASTGATSAQGAAGSAGTGGYGADGGAALACARVANEVRLHWGLKHPTVVELLEFFEDERFVYIVLELCGGGDLYRRLRARGPLNEEEAAGYMGQLLAGLAYLHGRRIIHRDLKLSNLLLSKDGRRLRIADFGLAVALDDEDHETHTICGTPNYMAPEVQDSGYGLSADLWSAGCLFYAMVTGGAPFQGKRVGETLANARVGRYVEPERLSPDAKDFMARMLNLDPMCRLSVEQAAAHPFLCLDGKRSDVVKKHRSLADNAYTATGKLNVQKRTQNDDASVSTAATLVIKQRHAKRAPRPGKHGDRVASSPALSDKGKVSNCADDRGGRLPLHSPGSVGGKSSGSGGGERTGTSTLTASTALLGSDRCSLNSSLMEASSFTTLKAEVVPTPATIGRGAAAAAARARRAAGRSPFRASAEVRGAVAGSRGGEAKRVETLAAQVDAEDAMGESLQFRVPHSACRSDQASRKADMGGTRKDSAGAGAGQDPKGRRRDWMRGSGDVTVAVPGRPKGTSGGRRQWDRDGDVRVSGSRTERSDERSNTVSTRHGDILNESTITLPVTREAYSVVREEDEEGEEEIMKANVVPRVEGAASGSHGHAHKEREERNRDEETSRDHQRRNTSRVQKEIPQHRRRRPRTRPGYDAQSSFNATLMDCVRPNEQRQQRDARDVANIDSSDGSLSPSDFRSHRPTRRRQRPVGSKTVARPPPPRPPLPPQPPPLPGDYDISSLRRLRDAAAAQRGLHEPNCACASTVNVGNRAENSRRGRGIHSVTPLSTARVKPVSHCSGGRAAAIEVLPDGRASITVGKRWLIASGDGKRVWSGVRASGAAAEGNYFAGERESRGADGAVNLGDGHSLTSLPEALHPLYRSLAGIVEALRSKTPKVVLRRDTNEDGNAGGDIGVGADRRRGVRVAPKLISCVLMDNLPDPDFAAAFQDGASLSLWARKSEVCVELPCGRVRSWQVDGIGSEWPVADEDDTAEGCYGEYLQAGMRGYCACLREEATRYLQGASFPIEIVLREERGEGTASGQGRWRGSRVGSGISPVERKVKLTGSLSNLDVHSRTSGRHDRPSSAQLPSVARSAPVPSRKGEGCGLMNGRSGSSTRRSSSTLSRSRCDGGGWRGTDVHESRSWWRGDEDGPETSTDEDTGLATVTADGNGEEWYNSCGSNGVRGDGGGDHVGDVYNGNLLVYNTSDPNDRRGADANRLHRFSPREHTEEPQNRRHHAQQELSSPDHHGQSTLRALATESPQPVGTTTTVKPVLSLTPSRHTRKTVDTAGRAGEERDRRTQGGRGRALEPQGGAKPSKMSPSASVSLSRPSGSEVCTANATMEIVGGGYGRSNSSYGKGRSGVGGMIGQTQGGGVAVIPGLGQAWRDGRGDLEVRFDDGVVVVVDAQAKWMRVETASSSPPATPKHGIHSTPATLNSTVHKNCQPRSVMTYDLRKDTAVEDVGGGASGGGMTGRSGKGKRMPRHVKERMKTLPRFIGILKTSSTGKPGVGRDGGGGRRRVAGGVNDRR